MKKGKDTIRLRSLLQETIQKADRESERELYSRYQALWKFSRDEYLDFLNVANYTNHGVKHAQAVEKNIANLLTETARENLEPFELFCLLAACCLHDIGMIDRKEPDEPIETIRPEHHIRVKELLKERYREFQLNEHEATTIGEICYGHGISSLEELDFQEWSVAPYGTVNVSFLTALLRIGDLLDLSFLRAPTLVADLRKIEGVSLRHWNLHEKISDVQIDHENKEILIFARVDNEHDLCELYSLKNWADRELQKVRAELAENGIFLETVSLRTKYNKKKVVLNKQNPFIRLDSFDWDKHVAFFGRDKETRHIAKITEDRDIVILVGESGVGKTSLLNAGLKQKLIEDGVYVFESRVTHAFSEEFKNHLVEQFPSAKDKSLPDALKNISKSGFRVAHLIDQFEELFTFFKEEEKRLEILDYISKVVSDKSINTRLIISLREDFLAELWEVSVSDQILALYDRDNTYRLKKLNRDNAGQIIVNTLKHVKHSIEDELLERLLDDFTKKEESIYPPYIQIVCHEIFKQHKSAHKEKSGEMPLALYSYQRLGGSEKIITDYFDEILDGFTLEERTVINDIMECMITLFYTKQRVSLKQILDINGGRIDIENTLERLIKHRIINKIETDPERSNEYELVHDFLAKKIMENKPGRWLSSNINRAIVYIEEHLSEQITLEDMAKHLGISREHFCRSFRKEAGQNFVDYVNKKRVEEVKKLLQRDPMIKFKEIYTSVGFTNPQHFAKVFKGITGQSPSEYKKTILNGEG